MYRGREKAAWSRVPRNRSEKAVKATEGPYLGIHAKQVWNTMLNSMRVSRASQGHPHRDKARGVTHGLRPGFALGADQHTLSQTCPFIAPVCPTMPEIAKAMRARAEVGPWLCKVMSE